MVKKCRFCKNIGHYMNDCNSLEKKELTNNLEKSIYSLRNDIFQKEKINNFLISLKPIELSLLAVKNNLPLNLSKLNYINLFLEIYCNTVIDDYLINFLNINSITENIEYFLINIIFFNKYDKIILQNEIHNKIKKIESDNILIKNIENIINNKKYYDLILYLSNENKFQNNIVLFYIKIYVQDINNELKEINNIEFDILNLYLNYYENFDEIDLKNKILEKFMNTNLNKTIIYFVIFRISKLYNKPLNYYIENLVNYYFNLILNKIKLNLELKSHNRELKMILIRENIYNLFNINSINDIIKSYDLINKKFISDNVENILLNYNKLDILMFYQYNFNDIDNFSFDDIINSINILYSKNIYNKIIKLLNNKYEENKEIENIEINLINKFFIYYYMIENNFFIKNFLSLSISEYILDIILKKKNYFSEKEKILLLYKNEYIKDILNNDNYILMSIKLDNSLIGIYSKYIKKLLLIFERNKNLEEIEIDSFKENSKDYIYFYYSIFKIKNNISVENMIDNLYLFKLKNEGLIINNIDFSIQILITSLATLNYEFKYESKFYENKIKKNISETNININESYCPICLEDEKDIIRTNCNHIICNKCFDNQLLHKKPYIPIKCCLCRQFIKEIYITSS